MYSESLACITACEIAEQRTYLSKPKFLSQYVISTLLNKLPVR